MANFNWPSISTSSGPIQFELDGVNTVVSQDTAVPANSNPLPVKILDSSGLVIDDTMIYVNSIRLDYSSTNVTTGAWVELLASVGASAIKGITLFDGGGYAMELGVGAAASETRTLLIPPGGLNGMIPLTIAANSRLSIRAVGTATVSSGEIDINLLR